MIVHLLTHRASEREHSELTEHCFPDATLIVPYGIVPYREENSSMPVRHHGVTTANYIGLSRIVVWTPIAITFVLLRMWEGAFLAICLSGISDILDGIIARREETVSNFGVFLDLTADKVFVSAMLLCLLYAQLAAFWCVLTILLRDFIVMGLRCFAASEATVLSADKLGGAKIVVTFAAILAIVLHLRVAPYLLIAATLLTVVSGLGQFWRARHLLRRHLTYAGMERELR